jgi:hypothetical protein
MVRASEGVEKDSSRRLKGMEERIFKKSGRVG